MVVGAHRGFPERLSGLLHPEAYGHPVQRVKLITTHLSWILLAGEFAYKIKRPVQYPFVDFGTEERRRHFCAEELRINSRFAPGLYLRLARVTQGAPGAPGARFDGHGAVIDHAVVMRAFNQRELLVTLVDEGRSSEQELAAFGVALARIHASLPLPEAASPAGSAATVTAAMGRNVAECLVATRLFGNQGEVALLAERQRVALARHATLIDARRAAGRVRETHGDLHLGNVVRIAGVLHGFDALEFEPEFRWADVVQDVAFLYADLIAARHPGLAQAFLNGYLQQSGDFGMLALLDLYVADRALVRAKVMALLAAETPAAQALHAAHQATYLKVVATALDLHRPACLIMHGSSGSGKSWLAARLALRLGSVVVRSDLERRRFANAAVRRGEHAETYGPDAVRATYVRLSQCAGEALKGGHGVILDATYSQRSERARVRELCRQLGAPLYVIDCTAPRFVLEQRVAQRQKHGLDPSEADLRVLHRQLAATEPLLPEEELVTVVADTSLGDVEQHVLLELAAQMPGTALLPGDPGAMAPGETLRSA
jgi:aminoglycoside phosphotransferase family enzyme/predicted kinase